MTATVVYVYDSSNTIWLALGTVLAALIAVGGSIGVAVISRRQAKQGTRIEEVHAQLKTSNGQSVGELVEAMSQTAEVKL